MEEFQHPGQRLIEDRIGILRLCQTRGGIDSLQLCLHGLGDVCSDQINRYVPTVALPIALC